MVSAPLNEHTEGMIGADQLRALGRDGVLINVGRGPLVAGAGPVRRAGARASSGPPRSTSGIATRRRDGVGAPSELPFAELPNLLMTPHSSGVTRDTFTGRVDDIAANIGRLQRGEPLKNVVGAAT